MKAAAFFILGSPFMLAGLIAAFAVGSFCYGYDVIGAAVADWALDNDE